MKILTIVLLLLGGEAAGQQDKGKKRPKNVILLIGDGMGVSQVTLGRLLGSGPNGKLAMDGMPVTGFVRTHSANAWVTDSAAAATALASGTKTNNFMIGMDPKNRRLESILELAKRKDRSVGLVTTTKITHATPAAFAAHVEHRGQEAKIAEQYLDAKVDVLLGGGRKYFGKDLLERYRAKGYSTVFTRDELRGAKGKLLGLFSPNHIPYVLDRKGEPSLAEMTQKALEVLSANQDGFFLMVEGGRIDQACHASDAPSSVQELIDFDRAVRAALAFAQKNGDTLVLVTADHGTGALAVTEKVMARKDNFAKVKASSDRIGRLMDQEKITTLMEKYAGVKDLTKAELQSIQNSRRGYDRATWIGQIISKRCGVSFIPMRYRIIPPNTVHGHDGAMVPLYAYGPGAERFGGTLDNTDVSKRIRRLAGY